MVLPAFGALLVRRPIKSGEKKIKDPFFAHLHVVIWPSWTAPDVMPVEIDPKIFFQILFIPISAMIF